MFKALKELADGKVNSSNVVSFEEEVEPTENQIYNASSMYEKLKELTNEKVNSSNVVSYEAEVEPTNLQRIKYTTLLQCMKP